MYVWKTLKVFLSSTFLDLELERDQLANIFTRLKQQLANRQLSLVPYDLRWRERHSDDPITHWCLQMVRQCQYFVGILGYRYGWRPPQLENGQANLQRLSVTEMEIREAIARVPKHRRFFCFGDIQQYDPSLIEKERPEDRSSIESLKQQLLRENEQVFTFRNQTELRQIVETQLQRIFDQDYPSSKTVEFVEYGLNEALESMLIEKNKDFVGRTRYLKQLEQFCSNSGFPNYLGIQAVAGTGKSSLLAKFVLAWRKQYPKIPIIAYFMSMTGTSRQISNLLLFLAEQLVKNNLITTLPLPQDHGELRSLIRDTLEKCQHPLVIAIDGLDELETAGLNLLWLPRQLPANVRIVLTTRPVDPWPILKNYPKLQMLELAPLEDLEIGEIIRHYAKEHDLNLPNQDIAILQKRAGGNPLYLKVALEEIGTGGVAVGQLAHSIEALFEQILQRLAERYGISLVWDYLGLLSASRYGLTESELVEILQNNSNKKDSEEIINDSESKQKVAPISENSIQNDRFVAISYALQNFLLERGGLIDFFHAEFERTLKERLGMSKMRAYHRWLADYFLNKGYTYSRTLLELPYQQQWSEYYSSVLATSVNFEFIERKCLAGMCDGLLEDWLRILHDPVVAVPEQTEYFLSVRPSTRRLLKSDFIGNNPSSKNVEIQNISNPTDILINRKTIQILAKILQLDLNFVRNHPKHIFQCLFNRGYWYDAPEASSYYDTKTQGDKDPRNSFTRLLEYWQRSKQNDLSKTWAKSQRPLAPHLDSPVLKILTGHTQPINHLSWDAEGKRIISASNDGTVRVWDAETGENLLKLSGQGAISTAIFSQNGQYIYSGGDDYLIWIWDSQTGAELDILEGHQDRITALALTPDGKKMISISSDGSLIVWKIESNINISKILILSIDSSELLALAVHPKKPLVVVGASDNTLRLWNIETQKLLAKWPGHERTIRSLAFDSEGKILASVGNDSLVKLWDIDTQQNLINFTGHSSNVSSISYLPAQTNIPVKAAPGQYGQWISGGQDNKVRIWQSSGTLDRILEQVRWQVSSLSLRPNGQQLVVGAEDGSISIWDIKNFQENYILAGPKAPITQILMSEDKSLAVTSSEDSCIYIWEPQYGRILRKLEGHKAPVQSIAISSDNKRLVSGSEDGQMLIWNCANGNLVSQIAAHHGRIMALAFLSENKLLSVGYFDKIIKIWNLNVNVCLAKMDGHERWIQAISLTQDRKILATASRDNTVRLWNLETMIGYKVLRGHDNSVTCLAFSPDQKQLVSGCYSGPIHIWDIESGACQMILRGHNDLVASVAFSSDGNRIISSSRNKISHIWDTQTGEILHTLEGQIEATEAVKSSSPYFALVKGWETVIMDRKNYQEIAYIPIPLLPGIFYRPNKLIGLGQITTQELHCWELL